MKATQKIIVTLSILILVVSCGSDSLSNSKAKRILAECLEAKPEQRTAHFTFGKATFSNKEHEQELLAKYLKLKDEGYLEMELLKEFEKGWRKGTKEYEIRITEKALEFMEDLPESGRSATAKSFKYEVDEILEVHENPSLNTAKIKVQYKAVEVTPFSIFSRKDPSEFWIDKLTMKKTSDGWKYCDDF